MLTTVLLIVEYVIIYQHRGGRVIAVLYKGTIDLQGRELPVLVKQYSGWLSQEVCPLLK